MVTYNIAYMRRYMSEVDHRLAGNCRSQVDNLFGFLVNHIHLSHLLCSLIKIGLVDA